ncbi:MAG: DUF421 domain-containing protein [Actinomycetota bacterium]
MATPLRALAIYLFLLFIFRLMGKRTLAQITTFDFVLLLILGEATQQGLIGDDFSVTTALLLIASMVLIEVSFSYLQRWSPRFDRLVDSVPVILMEQGKPFQDRMARSRVTEDEILVAARRAHGLESLSQVRFAILERDGGISIIPERTNA